MRNDVRQLRQQAGLSQVALAQQLGVSRQTVNALETGRYDPSLPLAFRIARLFARPIEAIFAPDENTQVPMDLNDAHGGMGEETVARPVSSGRSHQQRDPLS